MNKFLISSLALAGLSFSATQAQAANLVIDSFDEGTQEIIFMDEDFFTEENTAFGDNGNIIGGEREVDLEILETSGSGIASARVNIKDDGELNISNPSNLLTETTITWDGIGNSGLNLDLISSGTAFLLEIASIDLSANLELIVTDSLGEVASLAKNNLLEGPVLFAFEEFDNFLNTDFTQVSSIALKASGPDAVDLTVDFVATTGEYESVPEPATGWGLLALGSLGARLLRKRS